MLTIIGPKKIVTCMLYGLVCLQQKRTNNYQKSTWFMRDGSFLRLKSVEMGYTIPEKDNKESSYKYAQILFEWYQSVNIQQIQTLGC